MRDRQSLPPTVAMLRRQHPTTGVVIVAAALEPALMLEAMRAGVTEFLTAPLTAAELQAAIDRVTTPTAPTARGEVFAFVGAKGGVGTTTVAVNVATALAQTRDGGRRCSSICTSPTATRRSISAPSRASRCSTRSRTCIASTRPSSVAWSATSKAASRCWPRPIAPPRRRSIRRASAALIEAAARHYRYVVLDVPRIDVMLDALESASRIIIVANQELATVRAATRLSAALRQRYGKDRLSVVVSRFDQQSDIGQSDVERVLGSPVASHASRATTGSRSRR